MICTKIWTELITFEAEVCSLCNPKSLLISKHFWVWLFLWNIRVQKKSNIDFNLQFYNCTLKISYGPHWETLVYMEILIESTGKPETIESKYTNTSIRMTNQYITIVKCFKRSFSFPYDKMKDYSKLQIKADFKLSKYACSSVMNFVLKRFLAVGNITIYSLKLQ